MKTNTLEHVIQEDITLFVIEPVITINWFADDRSLPRYDLVGFFDHIYKMSFRQRPVQELNEVVKICLATGYLPNGRPYDFRGDIHDLSLGIKPIKVKPSDIVQEERCDFFGDTLMQIRDAFGHKGDSVMEVYEVMDNHTINGRAATVFGPNHPSSRSCWPNIYRYEPYDELQERFDSERDEGLIVYLEPTKDIPVYRIQSPLRDSRDQIKSSCIRKGFVLKADITIDDNGNQSYNGRPII